MFKKYMMTGLLVWIPLALTIWVLVLIVTSMDRLLLLLPPPWRPEQWLGFPLPGAGLVLTVLIVFATGMLAANIIGQRLVGWWESILGRIPIVSNIYRSVKQVSDTLLSQDGHSFRRAVLVEFPQRGQWSVGFVVGTTGSRLSKHLDPQALTVYVPTAPNPTSGYTLIVPPGEVRDVDLSVDEALKFVISMGVVVPEARVDTAHDLPRAAGTVGKV
ncbi:conserved hypothetical protein [Burkholderiales bacterium]|jgi:uncharacterized membrane protein|nr:conserved hypothetical protein [Burkholderiales bacterium]